MFTPRKSLGQHFLHDKSIAEKIVGCISGDNSKCILEVGPGKGALTGRLINSFKQNHRLLFIETDVRAYKFLQMQYPAQKDSFIHCDFLKEDLRKAGQGDQITIVGNFPYNISGPILFHIYKHCDIIPEAVGMLQKEVARRIAAAPGSKTYGLLSVLLSAFYTIESCFDVAPGAFTPPPAVQSTVFRMRRNDINELPCSKALFTTVVKTAFNQRRKILGNALSSLLPKECAHPFLSERAEQLSHNDFIELSCFIEAYQNNP